MSADDAFSFRDMGFNKLLKAVKDADKFVASLGVLGQKNAREGAGGNAEIGKKHEFGEITELNGRPVKLPERSFLRMPVTQKLQKELEKSGAFTDAAAREVIDSGNISAWLKKVGICGEAVVADAFKTGGFGQWPPSNMQFKTVHQTLVETQQLRNSITSEVRKIK